MTTATIFADPAIVVAPINRRIFGSSAEHLGRCITDGIDEPGHPTANDDGCRFDVVDEFSRWLRLAGSELKMAVNLETYSA